jgi:hypothetical protein
MVTYSCTSGPTERESGIWQLQSAPVSGPHTRVASHCPIKIRSGSVRILLFLVPVELPSYWLLVHNWTDLPHDRPLRARSESQRKWAFAVFWARDASRCVTSVRTGNEYIMPYRVPMPYPVPGTDLMFTDTGRQRTDFLLDFGLGRWWTVVDGGGRWTRFYKISLIIGFKFYFQAPYVGDYGQWIMRFRGQDYGIMTFGAQDYGTTRFRADDYGIMRSALDYENVCGEQGNQRPRLLPGFPDFSEIFTQQPEPVGRRLFGFPIRRRRKIFRNLGPPVATRPFGRDQALRSRPKL